MFAWRTQAGMPGDQTLLHKHRIAPPPIIFIWFSDTSTNAVILRGAEGEVAESIILRITFVRWNRGDLLRCWVRFGEVPLFTTPHPPWHGFLLPTEKVFLRFLKQWILQLRASPSCRMTWGCGERLEEEISFFKCTVTNGRKWTASVLYQTHASIKKECT